MLSAKKLSMIALLFLLIGFVGALTTFKLQQPTKPISENVLLGNESFQNINIIADNAQINVIVVKDSNPRVEVVGNEVSGRTYTFNAEIQENALSVSLKEKQLKFFNFNFLDSLKPATINVYVPEQLYEALQIDTVNGNITVKSLAIDQAFMKTINGRINIKDVASSQIDANSHNGNISIEAAEGDISAETINGKVTLLTSDMERNIDFKTTNGQIVITTEKEPVNAEIDVDVINGKVTVFGDSKRHVTFGNGQYSISLSTVNGKVTVTK